MNTSISYFRSTWWWWDDHTVAVIASLVVRAVVCCIVRAVVRSVVRGAIVRSGVVRGVGSASRNSGCINAIIKTAVLGNCNIDRLVISGCVHLQCGFSGHVGDAAEETSYRAKAVNASRKTSGDSGGKNTIHIGVVQALEEGKELGIGDFGGVKGGD